MMCAYQALHFVSSFAVTAYEVATLDYSLMGVFYYNIYRELGSLYNLVCRGRCRMGETMIRGVQSGGKST
jgi:hypothetical protein